VSTDPTIRKFLRAAKQRLSSAEFLAKRGQLWLDATYLAGYAPECALKALILARTPPAKRSALIAGQSGKPGQLKTHDLDDLRKLLAERRVCLPVELLIHYRRVALWSTELRYEVGPGNAADAEAFLTAAIRICAWVERSI
jgi:HEPN domain-containing protein